MFKIPNDCQFCGEKHFSQEKEEDCEKKYEAIRRMMQIAEVGKVIVHQINNSEELQYFVIARIIADKVNFSYNKNFSLVNAEEAPYSVRSLWRAEDRDTAIIWLKAKVISIKEAAELGWRIKNNRHWEANASDEMQQEYESIFRQLEIESMTEQQKDIMHVCIRQKTSPNSFARDEIIANMFQISSK